MKKHRTLKLYLLVSCLTIVLVFIGVNFAHAQKAEKQKKPPKTPDYTWSMTIPSETVNVWGMLNEDGTSHTYEDGIRQTRIFYSEYFNTTYHAPLTMFRIFIDASPDQDEYVGIGGVLVDSVINNNDGEPCGFPDDGTLEGCLQNFLNSSHPFGDYNHIMFTLSVFESLENFLVGEEVKWLDRGALVIYFWNSFDCGDGENVHYHSVNAKVQSMNCVDPAGFFITRTGSDTWRFRIESQEFQLDEHYCIEKQVEVPIGKSGKTKTVTETNTYYPQTAWTTLSYVFDLTRNSK